MLSYTRVLELVDDSLPRHVEDPLIVQGQDRQVTHAEPVRFPGCAFRQLHSVVIDQREVDHRHRPAQCLIIQIPERVELLQEHIRDAGFVRQLAGRGVVERLIRLECAAWDRPLPLVRSRRPLNQRLPPP